MDKNIKKWWDEYADYYQASSKIKTSIAHYGPFSPDERELNLLGNVRNKKILELGCGGGQCSIAFAKKGAKCTAIDFSENQLKFADKLAKDAEVKINFIKSDIQKFKFKKNEKFDIVFSSFALQFIPNLELCFKSINKILKTGGLFVFSLDHPFYSIVSHQGAIESSYYQTGKCTEWTTEDVFQESKNSKDTKIPFIVYKRKVSDIYNSLVKAGFNVEKILEPNTFSKKDPWVKMYSLDVIKLIGPTIIFSTTKIN